MKTRTTWETRRLGDFCRRLDVRLGDAVPPTILSVTKGAGVVPQSKTYSKQIASKELGAYKVITRGQFALAPMALYYGAIGRLDCVPSGIVSPAYEVFAVDETVDADYFAHLIRSPRMVATYETLSQGGNLHGKRRLTSYDTFAAIRRPMPGLPEQARIAGVLNAVADAVRTNEELVTSLREAKRAVMRDLLTRGLPRGRRPLRTLTEPWRMGRIAPDVTQVPAHWELVTLTKEAKLESGHTPSRAEPTYWNGGIAWVSSNDAAALRGLVVHTTEETISELGLESSSARILPKDTVVFLRTGGSVGLCSRLGRPMATSQHFANFVCGPRIEPRYLVQVFRHIQREWRRLGAGSVLPDVYMPVFKRLKVLLPPMDEQRAIADAGESFDIRIDAELEQLARLNALQGVLLRGLLSGQVQVPEKTGGARRERRAAKVG